MAYARVAEANKTAIQGTNQRVLLRVTAVPARPARREFRPRMVCVYACIIGIRNLSKNLMVDAGAVGPDYCRHADQWVDLVISAQVST